MFVRIKCLAQLFPNEEKLLRVPAGAELYHEGSTSTQAYVVKFGNVEIRKNGRLTEIGSAGCLLGEETVLNSRPKQATVSVISDCGLVVLDQARFERLILQTPGFKAHVMRIAEERQRAGYE